jgi:hypothetical protein
MGVAGSWTGVTVFLGLSPMAVAMVLSFFEAESLLPWEQNSCLLSCTGVVLMGHDNLTTTPLLLLLPSHFSCYVLSYYHCHLQILFNLSVAAKAPWDRGDI